MAIKLANLPYDLDALEPHLSSETLSFHYERHHRAYVDKLNKLVDGTPYADLELQGIIERARDKQDIDVLNNAEQAWNHAFLWQSMSPSGDTEPEGRIKEMVERDFGDVDAFRKAFRDAAVSQFGSGWAWLVLEQGKLRVISTGNADSPVGTRMVPLLTLDVWEHAYYIDFRNERARYVKTFLEKLINWKFVASNLAGADAKQDSKQKAGKHSRRAA